MFRLELGNWGGVATPAEVWEVTLLKLSDTSWHPAEVAQYAPKCRVLWADPIPWKNHETVSKHKRSRAWITKTDSLSNSASFVVSSGISPDFAIDSSSLAIFNAAGAARFPNAPFSACPTFVRWQGRFLDSISCSLNLRRIVRAEQLKQL